MLRNLQKRQNLKGPSADFFDFFEFSIRNDEILIRLWNLCCELTLRLPSNARAAVICSLSFLNNIIKY